MDVLNTLVGLNDENTRSETEDNSDDPEVEVLNFHDADDDDPDSNPSTSQGPRSSQFDQNFGEFVSETEIHSQRKIHREIRKLCFSNPGEMMQAEVTDRRSRRVAAQVQKTEKAASDNQKAARVFHDKKGLLVIGTQDPVDLCDCLQPNCHGCQWPCPDCGGTRCAAICQRNRKEFLAVITNPLSRESTKRTSNPLLPKESIKEVTRQPIKPHHFSLDF